MVDGDRTLQGCKTLQSCYLGLHLQVPRTGSEPSNARLVCESRNGHLLCIANQLANASSYRFANC